MGRLTKKERVVLSALNQHGRLATSTGNPPVLSLAKAGLISFVRRSEDFCVMELTDAGRAALEEKSDG